MTISVDGQRAEPGRDGEQLGPAALVRRQLPAEHHRADVTVGRTGHGDGDGCRVAGPAASRAATRSTRSARLGHLLDHLLVHRRRHRLEPVGHAHHVACRVVARRDRSASSPTDGRAIMGGTTRSVYHALAHSYGSPPASSVSVGGRVGGRLVVARPTGRRAPGHPAPSSPLSVDPWRRRPASRYSIDVAVRRYTMSLISAVGRGVDRRGVADPARLPRRRLRRRPRGAHRAPPSDHRSRAGGGGQIGPPVGRDRCRSSLSLPRRGRAARRASSNSTESRSSPLPASRRAPCSGGPRPSRSRQRRARRRRPPAGPSSSVCVATERRLEVVAGLRQLAARSTSNDPAWSVNSASLRRLPDDRPMMPDRTSA